MPEHIYHITNGDALSGRLKELKIEGVILTMRECLIDGPKDTKQGFTAFLKLREGFIYEQFGQEQSYEECVVSEFRKMQKISENSVIYFWFEDDLFCQANWWFLMYYLRHLQVGKFLVRSGGHSPYSFAGLSNKELLEAPNGKIDLTEPGLIQLWDCYTRNDLKSLTKKYKDLKSKYPFILTAFEAHIDRLPKQRYLGRPKEVLKQLTLEMGLKDFGAIFKGFQKQLPYYGYGDLQVRNMLNELRKE